jgi:hypothetical protein
MVAAYRPGGAKPHQGGITTVSSGRGVFLYIDNAGVVWLSAVTGTADIAIGEQITFGGSYTLV